MSMLLELTLLALTLAPMPGLEPDCGDKVCIYARDSGYESVAGEAAGSWKSGARLNKKQRRKQAKNNRKRKNVALNVVVEGGRGTVFVDGRYLASAGPHAQRELKPGKHEVEVRDGEWVVAAGVLTIPRRVTSIALVIHGDRD